MAKIKLFIGISLDGYIARPDDTVDWLYIDKDYGHTDFYNTVDTVMMGRRTYELMVNRWGYQFSDKKGYVISTTRDGEINDDVTFVGKDIINFVNSLQTSSQQDIWLVGGGQLAQFLLAEQLLDEMTLLIHPIMLGTGIPLFLKQNRDTLFSVAEATTYLTNGLVKLQYMLKK